MIQLFTIGLFFVIVSLFFFFFFFFQAEDGIRDLTVTGVQTCALPISDPRRMVKAHARSAMTMNFIRALVDGGFADLHHPEYWDLGWVTHSPLAHEDRKSVV